MKGVTRKAFFYTSYSQFNAQSDFLIKAPSFSSPVTARALKTQIFCDGQPVSTHLKVFSADAKLLSLSEREFQLPKGRSEYLFVIEPVGLNDHNEELMPSHVPEGQLVIRHASSYVSVLYDPIPLRDASATLNPIFHMSHYHVNHDDHETFIVLLNHRPFPAPSVKNKFIFEILDSKGGKLGSIEEEIAFNASTIWSLSALIERAHLKVPKTRIGSILLRGGRSQCAIFSVSRNEKTGALSIEHSLAPFYYAGGPVLPANRSLFSKKVFGEI